MCESVQAYQNAITAREAAANQEKSGSLPDGLKLEDAATLLQPGNKDGAVKVIRENGVGVAYSWSASRCKRGVPSCSVVPRWMRCIWDLLTVPARE